MRLTYDQTHFYVDGAPFDLASGDFHYFRTMPDGWQHRLALMHAFGLNTVQTYVPWNLHEPEKGQYHFEGRLDIRRFLELCQKMGLYVFLRPAPYICSECDWGGLPYWLMNEHALCPRTMDAAFLRHYEDYFCRLLAEIRPMLSTNGGPILAVAVENEYGSYGMDEDYLRWLAELYRKSGIDVPLYTTDGDNQFMLTHGSVHDPTHILDCFSCINTAAVTEDSLDALHAYRSSVSDPDTPVYVNNTPVYVNNTPVYVGEFWGGRAQQWGGRFARQDATTIASRYEKALAHGAHVNFYMFCGGTNFGSWSGANHSIFRADVPGARERYIPFCTSYDVDAPVTEDGRPTEKYFALREVLAKHRGLSLDALPPVPEALPTQVPEAIQWDRAVPLFAPEILDTLTETKVVSGNVRTMESLGQDYGFLLYTTHIRTSHPDYTYAVRIRGLHDRADIYVDGIYRGTYYRDRDNTPVTFRCTGASTRLDILVENLGRICYGYKLLTEQKGILDCVMLDRGMGDGRLYPTPSIVTNWECRSLPLRAAQVEKALSQDAGTRAASTVQDTDVHTTAPYLFHGKFYAMPGVDAFLRYADTNLTKGQVWINGFPLGRYWSIGPQETLYIPGELLKEENEITIWELYSDGAYPTAAFATAHQLDGLSENAECVKGVKE